MSEYGFLIRMPCTNPILQLVGCSYYVDCGLWRCLPYYTTGAGNDVTLQLLSCSVVWRKLFKLFAENMSTEQNNSK